MSNRTIKLAEQVAAWNASHPVGTPVMRYRLINPLREGTRTKTRSKAWVMGGHSAVVMVEGVSGGVLLESVLPINSNAKNRSTMESNCLSCGFPITGPGLCPGCEKDEVHPAAPCTPVQFKKWLQSHVDRYHAEMNKARQGSEDWHSYRSMRWACMFVLERFQKENSQDQPPAGSA